MTEPQTQVPAWIASRLDRPVAIFGLGASGAAARDLVVQLGGVAEVYDERKTEGARGDFAEADATRCGLAICSPGFAWDHPWLQLARAAGVEVAPELDLGAAFWRGPIIAITGTNGKTTLTEFLEKAFRLAGVEARACGNIGTPLSRLVADGVDPDCVAVCETSSFQAEASSRFRPCFALWTNFDEDHLDRHGSMRGYFEAKLKLFKQAGNGACFYDESALQAARELGHPLEARGLVVDDPNIDALGIRGSAFEALPDRRNYLMARALWLRMGRDEAQLIAAARAFRKSPHRLEKVAEWEGVTYWDDSKATNFHAVFGALERFPEPVVWIGGGKDKGGDIARFAARLAPHLATAHLIGQTKAELGAALRERGVETHVHDTLQSAVLAARQSARPGAHVLLSPGFASLDMFESYSHRGKAFKEAICNFAK